MFSKLSHDCRYVFKKILTKTRQLKWAVITSNGTSHTQYLFNSKFYDIFGIMNLILLIKIRSLNFALLIPANLARTI